ALNVLKEVVRLAPNLADSYHTLGLVYSAIGDKKKALNFYMIAAHLTPKDAFLWKRLVDWSMELGNMGQVIYCLSRAIAADPEDMGLKFKRASLYIERGDYQKAAESFDQILRMHPADVEACKMCAKMYCTFGQKEKAVEILERYIQDHFAAADLNLFNFLATLLMEDKFYQRALEHIERAKSVYCLKKLPLYLSVKAGICYAYLGEIEKSEGPLYLKIAQCYLHLKENEKAVHFSYKAIGVMEDSIDARLTLASLLCQENKEDEAISLLIPPDSLGPTSNEPSVTDSVAWWRSTDIRKKLAQIYLGKDMLAEFVDTIFPVIHETLLIEITNMKPPEHGKSSNKLRLKRKKKGPQLWLLGRNGKQQAVREPPLPNLLKDEEHYQLLVDALASLHRYWEELEIINRSLKAGEHILPAERKEELRSLGAQVAYRTRDPTHGYDYARYMVQKHPYSMAAWNCYYKVVSRMESRFSKHSKFLLSMRGKYKDCVPPIMICGHQFSMNSQHQTAAREYLEAYKLQPDNPLINLCVGTALINLALGLRVQNKNQCVAQGLAFLYNYQHLSQNSQEALYNIARAFHHVGFVTLAAAYYEKVLATHEKDYPIPMLPSEEEGPEIGMKGYCSLHREAAYNLHLIYKSSGAFDLARQVLKDYCRL
ncbi:General transcription factor 3C polypeptide 3, partial [Nymphaea thermarum]